MNNVFERFTKKKSTTKFYKLMHVLFVVSTFAMNLVSICLLMTGSHYTFDFSYGILLNKQTVFFDYPALAYVDIIFGALLIGVLVLGVAAHFQLKLNEYNAYLFVIFANVATLVWSLLYPLTVWLISGIVSPMLTLCTVFLAAYLLCALVSSLYFMKASYII